MVFTIHRLQWTKSPFLRAVLAGAPTRQSQVEHEPLCSMTDEIRLALMQYISRDAEGDLIEMPETACPSLDVHLVMGETVVSDVFSLSLLGNCLETCSNCNSLVLIDVLGCIEGRPSSRLTNVPEHKDNFMLMLPPPFADKEDAHCIPESLLPPDQICQNVMKAYSTLLQSRNTGACTVPNIFSPFGSELLGKPNVCAVSPGIWFSGCEKMFACNSSLSSLVLHEVLHCHAFKTYI